MMDKLSVRVIAVGIVSAFTCIMSLIGAPDEYARMGFIAAMCVLIYLGGADS